MERKPPEDDSSEKNLLLATGVLALGKSDVPEGEPFAASPAEAPLAAEERDRLAQLAQTAKSNLWRTRALAAWNGHYTLDEAFKGLCEFIDQNRAEGQDLFGHELHTIEPSRRPEARTIATIMNALDLRMQDLAELIHSTFPPRSEAHALFGVLSKPEEPAGPSEAEVSFKYQLRKSLRELKRDDLLEEEKEK